MPRLALLLALLWALPAPAQSVLVVSRTEVLETSRAARELAAEERQLTEALQREVDATKAELAETEAELARLRDTLEKTEFEARADAFRERVQTARREAQGRSARIQKLFRDARRRLVAALGPILEEVRARRGADVIVNAESVLAAGSSADVTEEVLAIFDERVETPEIVLEARDRPGAGTESGTLPAPAPGRPPLTLDPLPE